MTKSRSAGYKKTKPNKANLSYVYLILLFSSRSKICLDFMIMLVIFSNLRL